MQVWRPATDLAFDRSSLRENASGYFLTSGTIDWVRSFIGIWIWI